MQRSIAAARSTGAVSTLMGRRRPIRLTGDFQDRSAAERKVVNSTIQVDHQAAWGARCWEHDQGQSGAACTGSMTDSAGVQSGCEIHQELLCVLTVGQRR
jgi:hypothetical protein